MVLHVAFEFFAALDTRKYIIAGINPAYAEFEFEIPVHAQQPCMTVGDTQTGAPALIAAVDEFSEVAAEEFDAVFYLSEIILSSDGMESEEVAGETFAEPVACLWLHEPMFPFVIVDIPEIDLSGHVERPFGCNSNLDSEVGREKSVTDEIRLDSDVLTLCTDDSPQCEKQ